MSVNSDEVQDTKDDHSQNAINLLSFLKAQIHAIEKSVYIESEKANKNLRYDNQGNETQDFFVYWIQEHAREFNKAWCQSICKECQKVDYCYDCLKRQCDSFL